MTMTEEQRGTVAFDPEKARASIAHYRIENPSNVDTESALKELVDQANLAEDAIAEIERLRATIDAARIEERDRWLHDYNQQATRIKEMKKEIKRLKRESRMEQELTNGYIKRLHDMEAKIGPDARSPCWQITMERIDAIDQGLRFLEWSFATNDSEDTKYQIITLQDMLKEADKPPRL